MKFLKHGEKKEDGEENEDGVEGAGEITDAPKKKSKKKEEPDVAH